MALLRFTPDLGRPIDRFGSNFTMSKVHHDEHLHVGCMYIPAGGLVGYHPAAGDLHEAGSDTGMTVIVIEL